MKKGSKIAILILGVIIVMSGVFHSKLKFGEDYENPYSEKGHVKLSTIIKDLKNMEFDEGDVVLKTDEVNKLLGFYFKNGKNIGNIKIKGAVIDTLDKDLNVKIPFKYKNSSFILNLTGKASIKQDKIVYSISKAKLGKLTIPKGILLNKIRNIDIKDIEVSGSNILVDQSSFYFKIKNLNIDNDKVRIGFR